MPPDSTTIDQEGVLIDNFLLVDQGRFETEALEALLASGPYPVRNARQNVADLQAQIAACTRGANELLAMIEHFGLETVLAYTRHVQDNAEESVRRVLDRLQDGDFTYPLDNGAQIQVRVRIDREARRAVVDFTGTSSQLADNFNAPSAVCRAAVLYVFRTLVDADIPMNEGCLKPIDIVIPDGCMLNPRYPAAVVAGNVETSQCITDALYGALGVLAAAQGTMNNFTFGDATYQYYETICGGSGAGPDFDGTSAVHTHMTNSRLTDPGGAGVALSGAAAGASDPSRLGRRRPAARRRRHDPPGLLPAADERGAVVQPPGGGAVRPRGRPARRARPAMDRAGRRPHRGAARLRQGRARPGRRVRDPDPGRRRLRPARGWRRQLRSAHRRRCST